MLFRMILHTAISVISIEIYYYLSRGLHRNFKVRASETTIVFGAVVYAIPMYGRMMQSSVETPALSLLYEFISTLAELYTADGLLKGLLLSQEASQVRGCTSRTDELRTLLL